MSLSVTDITGGRDMITRRHSPFIGSHLRHPAWRFSFLAKVGATICEHTPWSEHWAQDSKQVEIFVVLPGGDVGFATGLRGEAGEFRFFDVGEIIYEGVAETFAENVAPP